MKRTTTFIALLVVLLSFSQLSAAQEMGRRFKMEGNDPVSISIDKTITESTEITPFDKNVNKVYGLSVSAQIHFLNEESGLVRFILVDKNHDEYLIYETHPLQNGDMEVDVDQICEETALLKNDIKVNSVKIEITDAEVNLKSFSYTRNIGQGINLEQAAKEIKKAQQEEKVKQLNANLQAKNKHWIAGITSVSEMSWAERKKLFGNSKFPAGFEFYAGGVISAGTDAQLKSASASPYVEEWDWRNRHGKNWISPIKNQSTCGSCWAFASTGATEAIVNVYYNQVLNLDLSEQDILSCSGGGDCNGGYPSTALNYITSTGVINEAAFPYNATYQNCSNKSTSPSELIKIGGKIDFGSTAYPKTEDDLKRMLIQLGPVSGGLYDWSHAMVLVGYKVVKEEDVFYYRDLNLSRYWKTVSAGDPLIGKTVWIFKNSWGPYFGDAGYVYVETNITNMGWTHALKTPVSSQTNYSVICEDRDGDGYYWWGLGPKPSNCPGPDQADGDDSDPTKGPLDQFGYCIPLGQSITPVANFSVSKSTITAGESVTFTDFSTNIPTAWSWSFPGGNPATSAAQNPTVTYSTPGTYNVTLTATNAGGSNTKTISGCITVNVAVAAPVANFTASKTSVTAGESVTFADLSTNNPTSWSWSFPGGNPATSAAQNPTVTYSTPGTYNVTLTATNSGGSNTKTTTGYITVISATPAPVADFTADNTVITKGATINFSDKSSNNPTTWEWSIRGTTNINSTLKNPSVKFDNAGIYDVVLKVSNDGGANTKTVLQYITVNDPQPTPPAEYCTPTGINSSADYIASVVINNGIKNLTTGTGYNIYDGGIMTPGKTYSISMTPKNTSARYYWRVWIDYNEDGDFDDSGETILSATNKRGTFKGNISIPAAISYSGIRMRVSMKTSSYAAPCDNNFNGEIEDYQILIGQSAASSDNLSAGENTFEAANLTTSVVTNEFQGNARIYPNPVSAKLNIDLSLNQSGDSYSIYNINGSRLVVNPINSVKTEIDMSAYAPGIYIIEIKNGFETFKEKIIKR